MNPGWADIAAMIEGAGSCTLVSIAALQGSSPREVGARMIVAPDGRFRGTIGGGALEWQALAAAQTTIARSPAPVFRTQPLGPTLGQCCGGTVTLAYQRFEDAALARRMAARETRGAFALHMSPSGEIAESDAPPGRTPSGGLTLHFGRDDTLVLLFGAGHVGRALVLALAPLPFAVRWIDQREGFPTHLPANVAPCLAKNPVEEAGRLLADASAPCLVLVMTHSHALDLAVCDAALRHDVAAYVGVVGSATKRARFANWLRAAGHGDALDRWHCPIGLPGIRAKEPAAIAASVAADMLMRREALADARRPVEARAHG